MINHRKNAGFTLIELLIVIAIIAIIAAIVFVALNPLKRFQDARDARRAADITQLLSAIKLHQVDNGGTYLTPITASTTAGQVYMIGTDTTGCNGFDTYCTTDVTTSTNCINLSGLVTGGYLGSLPISPNGSGSWAAGHTGYTLSRASTGIITVKSCENEDTSEISISR